MIVNTKNPNKIKSLFFLEKNNAFKSENTSSKNKKLEVDKN